MSKTIKTVPGKMYAVECANACTVTNSVTGVVACTTTAGAQGAFVATSGEYELSDDSAVVVPAQNFSVAPAAAQGGGGASVTVDATYNATSANPQAGTAVKEALDTLSVTWDATKNSIRMGTAGGTAPVANYTVEIGVGVHNTNSANSVAIGNLSRCREGSYSIALGYNSVTTSTHGVAIGSTAKAAKNCIALGQNAESTASLATAIGCNAKIADPGVTCIAAWDSANKTAQTLLYFIGAGSALATTYEGGEACLGYVVKDTAGNILACGTRKLSELLTNNTAFAPAALDLDAPAPTPFLPTGIMEPIVFDEPDDINLQ